MATERKSPDELLVQTNLTGTLSDIQDDPNSPDGNWLTYIANNVDTVCRVSFPTPTGNPTQGADLQEFKIWVRKQPGTGTPTVTISLYENGNLVTELMAATNVTNSSGEIFSVTWNANLLGTADGSLVELYIYGNAVGGAPSGRCTVEIGAVEWNVDYTIASDFEYTGSGSFTFSGTAVQTYTNNYLYTASGQFTYSGSVVQVYSKNYLFEGSGSLSFSGSVVIIFGLTYAGSGSLVYSGEAIYSYKPDYEYAPSGELIYSGEAIFSYLFNFLFMGSGEFDYSGVAEQSYERNFSYDASGGINYSGTAICGYTVTGSDFEYIGTGILTYSGNAVYSYGDDEFFQYYYKVRE